MIFYVDKCDTSHIVGSGVISRAILERAFSYMYFRAFLPKSACTGVKTFEKWISEDVNFRLEINLIGY
jgi:hypothetical protein